MLLSVTVDTVGERQVERLGPQMVRKTLTNDQLS